MSSSSSSSNIYRRGFECGLLIRGVVIGYLWVYFCPGKLGAYDSLARVFEDLRLGLRLIEDTGVIQRCCG